MTAVLPRTRRNPLVDVGPGDRWLIAVAHPDEETSRCGSLIAHAAAAGAEVVVVCATQGEAGLGTAGSDAAHLGAVRVAELRRAAARLGASSVELLGYRDSGIGGPARPGTLCAAPLAEVAAVLRELVRDLAPTVVVVIDGGAGHRDHVHLQRAMRAALPPATALYEHALPNSLMRRWRDEMRALRPDLIDPAIPAALIGRPDEEITDVLDVRDVLPYREAAIAEHQSQPSPFAGLSDDLRLAFLGVDHLVRVRAAVRPPWSPEDEEAPDHLVPVPSAALPSDSPRGGLR